MPFDPPISKTAPEPHRTIHEVDRMTRCGDIAIRNFANNRSVGWSLVAVVNAYTDILIFAKERSARGVKIHGLHEEAGYSAWSPDSDV